MSDDKSKSGCGLVPLAFAWANVNPDHNELKGEVLRWLPDTTPLTEFR